MAVDDYGIEVLKKAGEEVTPGDKSDYYIKTGAASGTSTPLFESRIVTGDIASGSDTVEIDCKGGATLGIAFRGTFSIAMRVRGTINGTDYGTVVGYDVYNNSQLTSVNASTDVTYNVSGLDSCLVEVISYGSGTCNIKMILNPDNRLIQVVSPLYSALRGTVQQNGTWGTLPYGLTGSGRVTEVTLNDSTWTALPASPLSSRHALNVQNDSGSEIKVNFSNAVATYTGMVVKFGEERFYNIDNTIILYGKSETGTTPTINVEEIS